MRTELWGLRDKATHEPIYTYWASSNKYRALFAKKETAEDACRNPRNHNMEPFCITGDPIRAAGGCRCGECRHGRKSADALEFDGVTPLCECGYMTLPHRWYEHCSWGEPREAQEDG